MKFSLLSLLFLTIAMSFSIPPSIAQNSLTKAEDAIEISAGKTLEWHQQDKQYIAQGTVEVKQGDVSIYAETLVADYKDEEGGDEKGGVKIYQMTATENVRIQNLENTATAQKAVYTVETGLAILTGDNLTLTTPEQKITATEKLEYNTITGLAKAVGNATLTQGKDRLIAQTLTAKLHKRYLWQTSFKNSGGKWRRYHQNPNRNNYK